MQITMVELNKNANAIINQAYSSGETVTIVKHGKPIAKIEPIKESSRVEDALEYFANIKPVNVQESIDSVINKGQQYVL